MNVRRNPPQPPFEKGGGSLAAYLSVPPFHKGGTGGIYPRVALPPKYQELTP